MQKLKNFLDPQKVEASLRAKNVHPDRVVDLAKRYAAIANFIREEAVPLDANVKAFWVPGRIELLGKHTDYAGGDSLLVASEKGFCVIGVASQSSKIKIIDIADGSFIEVDEGGKIAGEQTGWAVYPLTVCKRIIENFGVWETGGIIAFESNLPAGAGMSSSSAFVIAVALAIQALMDYRKAAVFQGAIQTHSDFADYLGHVENGQTYKQLTGDRGVGTMGGSQDHLAIYCAKYGRILHARFLPTQLVNYVEQVDDCVICIAVSGVTAIKTEAARHKYNRSVHQVQEILAIWHEMNTGEKVTDQATAHSLEDLRLLDEDRRQSLWHVLEEKDLAGRLIQFENEVGKHVPKALKALAEGDLESLGIAVDASQKDAERYLGNQIEETIFLARSARVLGAVAASAFGAGFGGAVWALVPKRKKDKFLDIWSNRYQAQFPQHRAAKFFFDRTGPGAFEL